MRLRNLHLLLLGVLTALAMGLCASTYSTFGHIWDEPEHIAAGMLLLDRGVYAYDLEHPPIARLAFAVGPYLAGVRSFGEPGPSGEQEGRDLLYRGGDYRQTLTLARLGALAFLPILFAATWAFARRRGREAAATLAVLFLATTPTLLGHASVAALDVPGTAMCTLALLALVAWLEAPGTRRGILLGIATGLAVGTKLSAVPFLLVASVALLLVRLALGQPAGAREAPLRPGTVAGGVLTAGVAAAAVLFVAYGARFEYLTDATHRASDALDYLGGRQGELHDTLYRLGASVPVPVAFEKLVLGVKALETHNGEGQLSYLLGQARHTGWWYFYPVALSVKTTLPLLGLGLAGLALLAVRGVRERDWRLAAAPTFFAAILAFCMFYSHINIGVRHVLVLFPLLAIGAGYSVTRLWDAGLVARVAAVALVAWQVSTVWRSHPDYLPYFNELVSRPEHVLIDSDLDWGQDMRRLETDLRQRGVKQFSFVFRGTEDWLREDLPPFTFLPPNLPTTGWVVVDLLAKFINSQGGDGYAWLDAYQPVARVGKTIDIYYIPGPPAAPGP